MSDCRKENLLEQILDAVKDIVEILDEQEQNKTLFCEDEDKITADEICKEIDDFLSNRLSLGYKTRTLLWRNRFVFEKLNQDKIQGVVECECWSVHLNHFIKHAPHIITKIGKFYEQERELRV